MDSYWELNEIEGKNPIHTGSFLNVYAQGEFTAEEVAAREGGQNTLDAGKDVGGLTELVFHKLTISGSKKTELLNLFEFEKLFNLKRLEIIAKNRRSEFFASNAKKFLEENTISALLIRDFNTCGLGGAWNKYKPKDHFARLVCALNLDDKADGDSNTGGSFGLGKTAYAKSSSINTVIYHSTFASSDETNNKNRRLMASGVYPRHTIDDVDFGGFAYFGKEDPDKKDTAMPFEDKDAKDLWEKIGNLFDVNVVREDNQHGTDVLILMDNLELGKIKKAIEDYYFPAINEGKISVKFIDEHGNEDAPRPLEREDLDQFIRLIKDAKNKELEEKNDGREIANLNKVGKDKIAMGRIAFEAAEEDEAKSKKNNCVAIMRGTGMIINYVEWGSERYEPAVGAFVADEDVWGYLKASEDPAHSKWSENSYRLDQDYPVIGPEIVGKLNKTIKNRFNKFQKSLQPDVSSTRSESGLLAKLLSGALSGSAGNPKPESGPNPVSVSLTSIKREENISVWNLVISDNDYTPDEPFNLKLLPSISLAGDSKKIAIKHMPFIVKNNTDGTVSGKEEKPELEFTYEKGITKLNLNIEFDNPGRKNFLVQCKCIATE